MTTPSEYTAKYSEQKAILMAMAQKWIDENAICATHCRVKWYQAFFMACAESQGQGGGWMTLKSFSTQDLPK